ncbi:MFS transporter [Planctomicrobium sp. SH668]|uniref:MFS transporter n=1 Tax=Planctomicrobium sp. SH668 TaxID=3448126 RepID=UPI003F5C6E56
MQSPGRGRAILVLLIIAAVLSYVDRQNLSVVSTNLKAELGFGNLEMGWLISAFFWSYSLAQFGAAWFSDRFSVKHVFAIGFLVWTLATLGAGLVWGFWALFVMRLLLGIGESVVYPCVSKILVANIPEEKRGTANALIAAGTKIGPAISILVGGLIANQWGWRPLFILTGVVSLLWLIPWMLIVPNERVSRVSDLDSLQEEENKRSATYMDLWAKVPFWGTSIGFSALGYSLYFLISYLPDFLETQRGFTKSEMAIYGSIPFTVMAVVTVFGGFLSDKMISSGLSATFSRLIMLVGGFAIAAPMMLLIPFVKDDPTWIQPVRSVVLQGIDAFRQLFSNSPIETSVIPPGGFTILLITTCACIGFAMVSCSIWAVTQTLAGEAGASKWSGVANAFGNLAGAFSSVITGWLHEKSGSYDSSFYLTSGVLLVAVALLLLTIRRVEPVRWKFDTGPVSES